MSLRSDAPAGGARSDGMGMGRSKHLGWLVPMLLFAVLGGWWGSQSGGIASSNDGSHLALARSLALRGRVDIDDEAALTLRVDLAHRGEHDYSDRPPGTAFLAIPSVAIGHRFDADLLRRSRAANRMLVRPASEPFARTYYHRTRRAPFLVTMLGSILGATLHAMLVGLLGLACIWVLAERRGLSLGARAFVVLALGLGTLWGPYATVLFSHVSAGALIAAFLLGLEHLAAPPPLGGRASTREQWIVGGLTGLAGAWAVACDYLLLLAVVPLAVLGVSWRRWPALLVGATPMILAVLLYHQVAFASPWSIGYDHHANFEFARSRGSTFDGDLLEGLATLWGTRSGAGMLAMAPVGLIGLLVAPWTLVSRVRRLRGTELAEAASEARRRGLQLLAWTPWWVVLALHHTPAGGQGMDHRYLIPILPMAALGLGELWDLPSPGWRRWLLHVALALAAVVSASRVWPHFLGWQAAEAFASPWIGAVAAVAVLAGFSVPRIFAYAFGGEPNAEEDPAGRRP